MKGISVTKLLPLKTHLLNAYIPDASLIDDISWQTMRQGETTTATISLWETPIARGSATRAQADADIPAVGQFFALARAFHVLADQLDDMGATLLDYTNFSAEVRTTVDISDYFVQ